MHILTFNSRFLLNVSTVFSLSKAGSQLNAYTCTLFKQIHQRVSPQCLYTILMMKWSISAWSYGEEISAVSQEFLRLLASLCFFISCSVGGVGARFFFLCTFSTASSSQDYVTALSEVRCTRNRTRPETYFNM